MAEEIEGMPVGAAINDVRAHDIKVTKGAEEAPVFTEDAAASIVWRDYQTAAAYLEQQSWLLEWQISDLLYQSPTPDRIQRADEGRTPRVPRFLVAKLSRTLSRAVKRGLFAEQVPFFLRPAGKTTQTQIDAWTGLIAALLKRAKFSYHAGLLIDCQTLQGTGIGKFGWEEKTVIKRGRRRKKPPTEAALPSGETKKIATKESDTFEVFSDKITKSFPFFEYRRLGTSLADPKWNTPDMPDESAQYFLDVEYVTFEDLQRMRELACYKQIPDDTTLKQYFAELISSAPAGTQTEESLTNSGGMGAHAESRNRVTSADPLLRVAMMIERWDERTVKTIVNFNGQNVLIRDEEHNYDCSCHCSATWWPIDNSGYGIGIGRIAGSDQRINQGLINGSLRMIAYPFNAPILIPRGQNVPTQNVIPGLGSFLQVDAPGGDVRKAAAFMEMPTVPTDAWKMLEVSQRGAEDTTGANAPFQQGNLGGPGSSAARTATGASRIAGMADQSVADPIDSFANGCIIPFIEFIVRMVKTKMPLAEIRSILDDTKAEEIEKAIDEDQFLEAEFEVTVLAGQKMAARSAIQQLLPFILQIFQQPQLLEFLHQRGDTIDFGEIMDLLLQVSELAQQPNIFRKMTQQEQQQVNQSNPGIARAQAQVAVEKQRGDNKLQQIAQQGQTDVGVKAAEVVMEHAANGVPLERANGLLERQNDKDILQNGLPTTGS